jgi:hypothetical protein
MTLFCMVCRGEMPEDRARRKKANTCSDQCQTEYRRRMRQERAEEKCRLCGRRFRRSRNLDAVPMEHKGFNAEVAQLAH